MASMIVETLKRAIERSGKSRNQIAKDTDIDPAVLHKLVHGGTASVETLDKLCAYFGLTLKAKKGKG
jgi:transcriptional regulator with XRE-family HTH domain